MMTLGEFKAKKKELEIKLSELTEKVIETGVPEPEKSKELIQKLGQLEEEYWYEQAQKDDTSDEFWAGQNKARFN